MWFVACINLKSLSSRVYKSETFVTLQVKLSDLYTLQEKRFRFIHRARQTFQIYTPCKTNISDCYKLQDKLFRFMNAASHTFKSEKFGLQGIEI
jgi:hypothetical protein